MSHALEGKIVLDIFLNGNAIPFGPRLTLNYLHMSTTRRQILPYLSFSVIDNGQWMVTNGLLGDGVLIQVKIQVGSSLDTLDHTFLMGYVDEKRDGGSLNYVIEGTLNKPGFLSGSSSAAIRGTSSQVLAAIAKSCEMGFEGVGTNDSQVWYGTNRRYHQFAQDVCQHGYVDPASCMQYGITLDGTLRYLDVSSMGPAKATLGLLQVGTPDVIPVVGFHPVASTGGTNMTTGYGMSTIEQNLYGSKGTFVSQDSIQSDINEPGQVSVSADVKTRVGSGLVSFGPMDPGNCHPQYVRAAHQNLRAGNLFSTFLEVTLPQISKLNPLDTVTVSTDVLHSQEDQSYDAKSYAGVYRVFDKIIYVHQTTYYEKLVLGRRTTSTSKATSSVAKGSQSAPVSASKVLTVKQSSVVGTPTITTTFFTETIAALSAALTSMVSSRSSAATSASAGANAIIANPLHDVNLQLTTVTDSITSILGVWTSTIEAFKLANTPLTLPTYDADLATLVTDAKAAITASIAASLPAVQFASVRSLSIATVSTKINQAASSLGTIAAPSTAPLTAVAGLTSSPSVFAAASAAALSANAAAASATVTVAASTDAATGRALTLSTNATTYEAQIEAAKTAAFSALDALAAP